MNTFYLIRHGGVVCDLLRNLFSDSELQKVKSDFPEELDKLIKECSVTTLVKNNDGFVLEKIGGTTHL